MCPLFSQIQLAQEGLPGLKVLLVKVGAFLNDIVKSLEQYLKLTFTGASLVVQRLRIFLLMQGTQVRALVWEDRTCRGATRPVSHNY